MKFPDMTNDRKNKKMRPIPPFECLDNGCKERSAKCFYCRYSCCTWFNVPVKEKQEH